MKEGWKVSGYWIHQKVRLSSWVTFPFKVKHSCICSEWVTPSQITSEKQDTWNRRPITDGLWTVNAQSDVKVRPGWNTSHQFTNKKSHSVYYITHHFRIQKGVEKMKLNELGTQKSERPIFLAVHQACTVWQAQHSKETTADSSEVSATGTWFFPLAVSYHKYGDMPISVT